jgi:GST-like protein
VLCGAPYAFEDVTGFDEPGPARDSLLSVNPLAQVPTLVLANGEAMTESAAIAIWLSEAWPDAGLAPVPGDPLRPAFLRRLVWIVANIYPTFTYSDYPTRWVTTDADQLRERLDRRRVELWTQFERELPPGEWSLGARFSVLDVYVAVMTHWRPGPAWFAAHCPRLHAIAAAAARRPRLVEVMAANFPPAG